eukprot:UN27241
MFFKIKCNNFFNKIFSRKNVAILIHKKFSGIMVDYFILPLVAPRETFTCSKLFAFRTNSYLLSVMVL